MEEALYLRLGVEFRDGKGLGLEEALELEEGLGSGMDLGLSLGLG